MTCDKREHTEQDHSAEERLVAEVRRRAGHPPDPWEPVASVGAFTRDARDARLVVAEVRDQIPPAPDPGTRPPRRARG